MATAVSPRLDGCTRCVGARLASLQPATKRKFKGSWRSLAALFAPAVAFAAGLIALAIKGGVDWRWLRSAAQWPWELWTIAGAGSLATLAGVADWQWHRRAAGCAIGPAERRCELIAMAAGGGPLFIIMASASLSSRPLIWLLPAMMAAIATTVMICYDEFIFHRRRCRRWETLLHRTLVFGQGMAWLAWSHWCFIRGGGHAVA